MHMQRSIFLPHPIIGLFRPIHGFSVNILYITSNLTLSIDQSIHEYMFAYIYSLSELFCSSLAGITSNLCIHVLPYEFKCKLGQI
jgi:hypothetical protein